MLYLHGSTTLAPSFLSLLTLTIVCGRESARYKATTDLSVSNDLIKMRIISDPVSISDAMPGSTSQDDEEEEGGQSSPRWAPSAFSGPGHFRSMVGQCFSLQKGNFEYKLCPFHNATQRETTYSFNRKKFSGVIGIWYEWMIGNDSFVGWRMIHGDACGSKPRFTTKCWRLQGDEKYSILELSEPLNVGFWRTPMETAPFLRYREWMRRLISFHQVQFECGGDFSLKEVSETVQCHYEMKFQLPQACYPDSLLVYPVLSEKLQEEWNILEGARVNGELTTKGYNRRLREILLAADLLQNDTDFRLDSVKPYTELEEVRSVSSSASQTTPKSHTVFHDLHQCQKAYDALVIREESVNGFSHERTNSSTLP